MDFPDCMSLCLSLMASKNINFTMELEQERCLPLLDALVYRKNVESLGEKADRKLTHTNLYLNSKSHHHPAQKISVLCTLAHRAKILSDLPYLGEEVGLLRTMIGQRLQT